ncbi:hypothetical protein [Sphingomonas sp. ABOLF]|uniref:hypothetical protein n=1 Tax=Sphingomonas sp. ABOLF TaxID=1985879 RepID=UPI000F7D9800|nr:hypothetical protein [Sphingomonas sp. ABOLF]
MLATVLFGLACAVTIMRAAPDNCRLAMALALAELWAVANLAYAIDALVLLPVLDLLVAMVAASMRTHATWVNVLLMLVGARLAAHILYGFGWLDFGVWAHGLNIAFAAQLAIVATSEGERDGARRRCGVLLRRIRGDRGGTHPATAAEA